MGLGALSDHGDDSAHPQLHALLNRPLHSIKLEDGEKDGQVGDRSSRNNFAELKLYPAGGDAENAATADTLAGRDVKLLSDPSTKNLREVLGVRADQGSAIAKNFVRNPPAAGHANFAHIIILTSPSSCL
jgi:hypothetical protein